MMESTAFIMGTIEISWNAILIALAVLTWFFASAALYTGKKNKVIAIWLMLPFAFFLSAFLSRSVYWYSHQSQFHGYFDALKSTDLGAFSLLGILPGIFISAALMRLFRINTNLPQLLDDISAPTSFMVALLYLTCLFNDSCRGKVLITNPAFHKLPFAYININPQGEAEYRLATFFIGFIIMLIIGIATLFFHFYHKKEKGLTAFFFLVYYSAAEFVIESTRYDAGYFPTNGFVSIIQIFSAVCVVATMVYFTVERVRKNGFGAVIIILWIAQLLILTATGILEYLVQRHGDWAYFLHPSMCVSCFFMAFVPMLMHPKKTPKTTSDS